VSTFPLHLEYVNTLSILLIAAPNVSPVSVSSPKLTCHLRPEPQIKYESPYSAEPPQYDPNHSPLKRRFSETTRHAPASDEKRQRIEVEQPPPLPLGDDMDFAAMIAQAAAAASQEAPAPGPATSSGYAPQEPLPSVEEGFQARQEQEFGGVRESAATISSGFSADPHLYMRILSLPILESLVGDARSDRRVF
jgi:protein TBF1